MILWLYGVNVGQAEGIFGVCHLPSSPGKYELCGLVLGEDCQLRLLPVLPWHIVLWEYRIKILYLSVAFENCRKAPV